MIPVSKHVQNILTHSPFLEEVLSEKIANLSAVAAYIHADVEKKAKTKVSQQSIVMALSRLNHKKRRGGFGLHFLRHMENISVRTGMTLIVASTERNKYIALYFKQKKVEYLSRVSGSLETLYVCSSSPRVDFSGLSQETVYYDVTAITLTLPKASLSVPGVYYPILKKLSWNGINIIELVSVGQELTFYIENKDTERAFTLLNTLRT